MVPDLANPGTELSLKGLRPNRAPADSVFLSALYSFDFAAGMINVYAGYKYFDDYQTNPNIPVAKVHNYTTSKTGLNGPFQPGSVTRLTKKQ